MAVNNVYTLKTWTVEHIGISSF